MDNNNQNINPNPDQTINQNNNPNVNQNYNPNVNQNYNPNVNQNYNPNLNQNYNPNVNQNYNPNVYNNNNSIRNQSIPYQYMPLSPWAYIGYELLFSIPIIGFICLIIFALNDSNINRRNFARSYFCIILIVIIITVVLWILGASLNVLKN